MKYEITEAGIRYIVEPEPIPDAEAVEIVKRLADKQRADWKHASAHSRAHHRAARVTENQAENPSQEIKMNKFYDLAMVDKCDGKMIATWAGLACTFKDALLNLLERSEGKIPPAVHRLITLRINDPAIGSIDIRYGYVVRSMSEVREF